MWFDANARTDGARAAPADPIKICPRLVDCVCRPGVAHVSMNDAKSTIARIR